MSTRYDSALMDRMYNNRALVPEHAEHFRRWAADSADAMRTQPRELDLRYGGGPSEHLDIFPAAQADAPVLFFIHGGYWRSLDKRDHSFVAPAFTAKGVCVVIPNYALAPAITIPQSTTGITIAKDGIVSATVAGQTASQQIGTIELASFQNPAGLKPMGGNLFTTTSASGEPQTGAPGTDGRGTVQQGFLEDSNVSVVEEMVNMILGQRAYEANSKVIRAADEMLQQVNNLAR